MNIPRLGDAGKTLCDGGMFRVASYVVGDC